MCTLTSGLFWFDFDILLRTQPDIQPKSRVESNSSNRYGYFNTLVFGYYLSLNTNTCALWATRRTEEATFRQFMITPTCVRPKSNATARWQQIWTIKSHHCRHLTGSHINISAPTRLCSSFSLFSGKYSLTAPHTKAQLFYFKSRGTFVFANILSCQTNVQPVVLW